LAFWGCKRIHDLRTFRSCWSVGARNFTYLNNARSIIDAIYRTAGRGQLNCPQRAGRTPKCLQPRASPPVRALDSLTTGNVRKLPSAVARQKSHHRRVKQLGLLLIYIYIGSVYFTPYRVLDRPDLARSESIHVHPQATTQPTSIANYGIFSHMACQTSSLGLLPAGGTLSPHSFWSDTTQLQLTVYYLKVYRPTLMSR
jgi:hypothetical protein